MISGDAPRFKNELDAVVYICKHFWARAFGKQIDNLKTNHQVCVSMVCVCIDIRVYNIYGVCHTRLHMLSPQDTYVLHDSDFRLLSHMSDSSQYKDQAPLVIMCCSCVSPHR